MNAVRAELERQGYAIVREGPDELVAVRAAFYWDCMFSKLTLVVPVWRVGTLTAERIEADLTRLGQEAKTLDPSRLPRGFQKGTAVLPVYFAEHVDGGARAALLRSPKKRWAAFQVPAAKDESTGEALYLRSTPAWGGIYYGKFRHLFGRLLEPEGTPLSEPRSWFGLLLLVVIAALFGWLALGR